MKAKLPTPSASFAARLRRLDAEFLRPHRRSVLLALAGMFLGSLFLLPVSLVQGWMLDRLLGGLQDDPSAATNLILGTLVIVLACHLGRMFLVWRGQAIMNRVSLEVVRELTDALHRKFQRLPLAYFEGEQTGQLMARITSDVGSLMIFLGSGSLQLASDLVLALGIAGVLLWLRWQLALVCFVIVPLYAVNHQLFAARFRILSERMRSQIGAVYALLSERISAVRVVRAFAREETELRHLDERIDAHRDLSRAGLWTGAWQSALSAFITGAGTVAVLVSGIAIIRAGQLSVGDLLAFCALTAQLYNPIVRLVQFQGGAAGTRVAIERMMEVLEAPETLRDRPDARPLPTPQGRLVFENVSFRYKSCGPKVLDGINLTIEPGMTVGVLGASGAGKSTLLLLPPRLYDVDEGRILLDGRDVRELRQADLRQAVVAVPQQAVLFEGTLRSNLLYAAPAASAALIRRVLEALDLEQLIESLPLGLETRVGERGYSLSGGQRQRLALARALLAQPQVLLLDDCTSALDAETEARVQAALNDLLPERTKIILAHKVASLLNANWVVMLEGGRIIKQGRPVELFTADDAGQNTAATLREQGEAPQKHFPTLATPAESVSGTRNPIMTVRLPTRRRGRSFSVMS
jgi:ABC-type multidrug transport system fused ATPase/permease subunit